MPKFWDTIKVFEFQKLKWYFPLIYLIHLTPMLHEGTPLITLENKNRQIHSNNSSANCQRVAWVFNHFGFLTFSGGTEMENWREMGW